MAFALFVLALVFCVVLPRQIVGPWPSLAWSAAMMFMIVWLLVGLVITFIWIGVTFFP